MISDQLGMLLYIEPRATGETPVVDELTDTMNNALAEAKSTGRHYRGVHRCVCGQTSTNTDYVLPNGDQTNSLAVHYLRDHRSEVPTEQLDRVRALT